MIPLLLICIHTQVKGQVYFDNLYDSEAFNSTNEGVWGGALLNDDGYVFLSFARDLGLYTSYTWLVQTDLNGGQVTSSFFGSIDQIFMPTALIHDNGGYIGLATYSEIGTVLGRNQFSLHKFNAGLGTDWVRYYGDTARNDNTFGLIRCFDNGLLLVGQSSDNAITTSDMYVVRTDPSGNKIWERYYGGSSWEAALSAVQTPDHGFLLLGWTRSYGAGQRDFYLVKTDSLGNQEWQRTYGGSGDEGGKSILALSDGNYLLTGSGSQGSSGSLGRVYKIRPDGSTLWAKTYTYPGNSGNNLHKTVELPNGDLASAGLTDRDSNSGWLIRTDSLGQMIWQREYDKNQHTDLFYSVLATEDGGFLLSGQAVNTETNSQDAWLLKVDSMGCPYPNCTVGIEAPLPPEGGIWAWPNPASEVVNVQWHTGKNAIVTFTDMLGRSYSPPAQEVQGVVGPYMSFDVNTFENGIYVLTIIQNSVKTTLKVVVQH